MSMARSGGAGVDVGVMALVAVVGLAHGSTLGFRTPGPTVVEQTGGVARWEEFEAAAPDLAAGGRRLLYQFGLGLGFLATIRKDGGPRLHPFCPILAEGGLWGFIGPSPKCADLRRDRRFAVHSFPAPELDDEFYVQGQPLEVDDPAVIAAVRAAYTAPIQDDDEVLFELRPERALLAVYTERPSWPPTYSRWAEGG